MKKIFSLLILSFLICSCSKENMEQDQVSIVSNQWTGKKIVWLGTSIPWGQTFEYGKSSQVSNPYPKQVGDMLNCSVLNHAQKGMAIETTSDYQSLSGGSLTLTINELKKQKKETEPYKSFENAMLGFNADLYVFDCEPNNLNSDLSILDKFDFNKWRYEDGSTLEANRNSFIGALIFLIDKLWTENPLAKVVFVGEYAYLDDRFGKEYKIQTAAKLLARKLRIPYIDVWSKMYYNKQNVDFYMNPDMIHPKQLAHDRIAMILVNELLLIY